MWPTFMVEGNQIKSKLSYSVCKNTLEILTKRIKYVVNCLVRKTISVNKIKYDLCIVLMWRWWASAVVENATLILENICC